MSSKDKGAETKDSPSSDSGAGAAEHKSIVEILRREFFDSDVPAKWMFSDPGN